GQIGWVPTRRPRVGPLRNRGDLFIAQRRVILVVLDADVLLDVPGWHRAHPVTDGGALLHRARPGSCVLVGEQRHRRDLTGPMAVLAAALQNRREVFGEGYLG